MSAKIIADQFSQKREEAGILQFRAIGFCLLIKPHVMALAVFVRAVCRAPDRPRRSAAALHAYVRFRDSRRRGSAPCCSSGKHFNHDQNR